MRDKLGLDLVFTEKAMTKSLIPKIEAAEKAEREGVFKETMKKRGTSAWMRAVRNANIFSGSHSSAPSKKVDDETPAEVGAEKLLEALAAMKNRPGSHLHLRLKNERKKERRNEKGN